MKAALLPSPSPSATARQHFTLRGHRVSPPPPTGAERKGIFLRRRRRRRKIPCSEAERGDKHAAGRLPTTERRSARAVNRSPERQKT